jgi:hypothetical protein
MQCILEKWKMQAKLSEYLKGSDDLEDIDMDWRII